MTYDAKYKTSSIKQGLTASVLTQNMKSAGILSKDISKPVKDQIIDFNVPIHTDVKEKETTMKPHALNSVNMKQYDISKTWSDKCDSLRANERIQKISKCTLPKTKILVSEKQVISSKIKNNFVDVCTLTKYIDESPNDQTEYRMKEKYSKRKAVSFSPEKKVVKNQKKNPILISKCLQTESNENEECVNIICQFYDKENAKNPSIQDSQTVKSAIKTPVENTESK